MKVEQQSPSVQVGTGRAFGTFGELLQGRDASERRDFLVTLPIERYAHATFVANPDDTEVVVYPSFKEKSRRMAQKLLDYFSLPMGGTLRIESELPIGKGLASSSADLVATARAICSCFRVTIPLPLLATFMSEIEPSDGVMYPGIVAFYHREGCLRQFLGFLPPLTIVGIDEGSEIDTLAFNARPKPFTTADEWEYQQLLTHMATAVRRRDIRTIGQITTRSAILNQKLNPKSTLNDFLRISEEIGCPGVVVAHSGTCIGLLLARNDPSYHHQVSLAYRYLSALTEKILFLQAVNFPALKKEFCCVARDDR
uniref:Kinase n=1 Tax=Thermosporothrix sp. COM3 TaxID=2490863 RepID=A0A455SK07_9CHLR|nr:kinase [Thermosporothrix sp. COM3]